MSEYLIFPREGLARHPSFEVRIGNIIVAVNEYVARRAQHCRLVQNERGSRTAGAHQRPNPISIINVKVSLFGCLSVNHADTTERILMKFERFCDVTLYCSPSFATQVSDKDTVDPTHIRGVSLRAHRCYNEMQPEPTAQRVLQSTEELEIINLGHPSYDHPLWKYKVYNEGFTTSFPRWEDGFEYLSLRSLNYVRVVLAACSELLGALLGAHEAQGEPVLVIDGAEPRHLRALLHYMYTGEMNVHHSQLASLLKTAEELRIKGLTDIRWNNKDEPPDCDSDVVTAVATHMKRTDSKTPEKHTEQKHAESKHAEPRQMSPKHSPKHILPDQTDAGCARAENEVVETEVKEKFNVNGGPPPLIKLPTKDKPSPAKRDRSDSDSPSPKRQRLQSGTEHTDDESASHSIPEKDSEWQHGNLDISAERVVNWGGTDNWSRDASDDEWADAPADIGSFLHTRLRVDGDNSADEESNDSAGGALSVASAAASSSASIDRDLSKIDLPSVSSKRTVGIPYEKNHSNEINIVMCICIVTIGPKSGPADPRFSDVVKLNDYLQHGRRPQFWEEHYVKRVMEAVRMKELEMKQAAEILGVSYGTLYGRYRDVFGCINRPYRGSVLPSQREEAVNPSLDTTRPAMRTARDFWQAKGPSEVLERLQRGDISVEAASLALGVGVSNLAAYMAADFHTEKDFDPIPIEVDPSLKVRRTYGSNVPAQTKPMKKPSPAVDKSVPKKIMIGSLTDEDPIPATVIATSEANTLPANSTSGKWPTIRVASLDTLRAEPASPSALMRTRPDLTIVAAKRDKRDGDA
ncbi:unnamed protein product [Diatraea saccharalis]|uniref:BTB domain-containing protein n=1 Tax=Diatraea saccharalis TaxID=40085 RepID=A0A9N9WGD5_9NEOP|nr:unnamed protein product [Diatraea saccharalis]